MRALQCSLCFGDIQDLTQIPEAEHRAFFPKFVEFGLTVLVDKYDATPAMKKLIKACERARFIPSTVAALEPDDFF